MFHNEKISLQLENGDLSPIKEAVRDGWRIVPLNTMDVRGKWSPRSSDIYVSLSILFTGDQEGDDQLQSFPRPKPSPPKIGLGWGEGASGLTDESVSERV